MSFGLLERDVKEQPLKGPAFWKWVDERGGVKNARVNGYGLRYIDLGSESDRRCYCSTALWTRYTPGTWWRLVCCNRGLG